MHTQICHEFERFLEFMPAVKVANFFGGIGIQLNKKELKEKKPSIVVGTPGRIKQVRSRRGRAFTWGGRRGASTGAAAAGQPHARPPGVQVSGTPNRQEWCRRDGGKPL